MRRFVLSLILGWTVYYVPVDGTNQWFGAGTYLVVGQTAEEAQVYLQQSRAWRYQGPLSSVVLPPGFPNLTMTPAFPQAAVVPTATCP